MQQRGVVCEIFINKMSLDDLQNMYTLSAHGSVLDTPFIIPKNITIVTLVQQGSCYNQTISDALKYLYKDISNKDILAIRVLNDILDPETTSVENLLDYAWSKDIDLSKFEENLEIRTHSPCTKMSDMKLNFLTWYEYEEDGSFIPGVFPIKDIEFLQRKTYVEFENISNYRYIPIEGDYTSRLAVNELFCGNTDIRLPLKWHRMVFQHFNYHLMVFEYLYIQPNGIRMSIINKWMN